MNILIWNYIVIALVVLSLEIDRGAVIRRDWWLIMGHIWSAGIWPLAVARALWRKWA